MEPTIYKPGMYKSPGIYNGAGGIYKGRGIYNNDVNPIGPTLPFVFDFKKIDFSLEETTCNGVIINQKNCHLKDGYKLTIGPGNPYENFFRVENVDEQLGEWSAVEIDVESVTLGDYRYIGMAAQNIVVGSGTWFSNFGTWVGSVQNTGNSVVNYGNYNYSGIYDDLYYLRYENINAVFPLKIRIELDRDNNILKMFWNDVLISETYNSYSTDYFFNCLHINTAEGSATVDAIVITSIKVF